MDGSAAACCFTQTVGRRVGCVRKERMLMGNSCNECLALGGERYDTKQHTTGPTLSTVPQCKQYQFHARHYHSLFWAPFWSQVGNMIG